MERIKTNIIELEKLYKTPCKEWLKRFDEQGKLDAHQAFKKYMQQYEWLYKNSPYDLIGWEIENNCFDWKKNSWVVAKCCPDKFDPERYNWQKSSWAVAKYCPEKLDPERYNWERCSVAIAEHCPEHLDPERYNWEEYSWAVAEYCPDKLKFKPKK